MEVCFNSEDSSLKLEKLLYKRYYFCIIVDINQINKLIFLGCLATSEQMEMNDFLAKVVFRSEQQPRHGIKVKQIEKSLSLSEVESLIHMHCIEK